MTVRRTSLIIPMAGVCAMGIAKAQNTGGIFPPNVTEGAAAAEYRLGYRPGEDGAPDRWANRLHYQRAMGDNLMWRVVGQVAGPDGDQDFDYVQAELFWEFSENTDRWRTGLRFDATYRDGNRPEELRVNWTNELALSDRWRARFILLNKVQFGDRAADGIAFETRSNLFYRTDQGISLGVESFNLHVSTEDFDFFGARQQVGPFAVIPIGQDWSVLTSVLIGANDASPDTDLRFWVTRNF